MKEQDISTGNSYFSKNILHSENIKYISDSVIKLAKSKVRGDILFTKISDDLIINRFEIIRNSRPGFSVNTDNSYNFLERVIELTIQNLTEDVVTHYYDEKSKKDYSIWNTVGNYTPDSYKAINVKKQTLNPTFDTQYGDPRF